MQVAGPSGVSKIKLRLFAREDWKVGLSNVGKAPLTQLCCCAAERGDGVYCVFKDVRKSNHINALADNAKIKFVRAKHDDPFLFTEAASVLIPVNARDILESHAFSLDKQIWKRAAEIHEGDLFRF